MCNFTNVYIKTRIYSKNLSSASQIWHLGFLCIPVPFNKTEDKQNSSSWENSFTNCSCCYTLNVLLGKVSQYSAVEREQHGYTSLWLILWSEYMQSNIDIIQAIWNNFVMLIRSILSSKFITKLTAFSANAIMFLWQFWQWLMQYIRNNVFMEAQGFVPL